MCLNSPMQTSSSTRPSQPPAFQRVALFGKFRDPSSAPALEELAQFLRTLGIEVLLNDEPEHIDQRADLAIVMGGDGTMLGVARQLAADNIPLIGINQGRLGFMTDIPLAQRFETLEPMMRGEYVSEQRSLLQAHVERPSAHGGTDILFEAIALNDVVVARGAVSGMVEVSVSINGQYTYTQRADGLIIATPTGSTAYALSAHGPVLHPGLGGFVLVPIAPQSLSNRPIVVPDDVEIVVTLDQLANSAPYPATASFDMQTLATLQEGDRVVVKRSPHRITFLHPRGYNYFGVLRQKLNWTLMPVSCSASHETFN